MMTEAQRHELARLSAHLTDLEHLPADADPALVEAARWTVALLDCRLPAEVRQLAVRRLDELGFGESDPAVASGRVT